MVELKMIIFLQKPKGKTVSSDEVLLAHVHQGKSDLIRTHLIKLLNLGTSLFVFGFESYRT